MGGFVEVPVWWLGAERVLHGAGLSSSPAASQHPSYGSDCP